MGECGGDQTNWKEDQVCLFLACLFILSNLNYLKTCPGLVWLCNLI